MRVKRTGHLERRFHRWPGLGIVLGLAGWNAAFAATYALPAAGDDLVGENRAVIAQAEDTLLDIARRYDLGFNEIAAANPGVDPWLPKAGTRITVPTRFVLPHGAREGIVLNLPEMRLYYYPQVERGRAPAVMTFPIGVGREGWLTPLGLTGVVGKVTNPAWVVPASIQAEHAADGDPLPKVVPPGPDNPLGEFALRLGFPGYLIHGTNKAYSVGMRTSHGCIRMYPEDIAELYGRVAVGTPVRVVNQPYKSGRAGGVLYLEAHAPLREADTPPVENLTPAIGALMGGAIGVLAEPAWERVRAIASRHDGIPAPIDAVQAATAPALDGWFLQLGVFHAKDNAERMAHSLRKLEPGLPVTLVTERGGCRVLVGPYAGKGEARAALGRVLQGVGAEGLIIAADRLGEQRACVP